MSKSEIKTDIWGDKYVQHYDDQGNKTGTTRVETDMWGDSYEQHRNTDGEKSGSTTHETDMWGDSYEQHQNTDGEKTGYTTRETDIWGDPYEQHKGQDGAKAGYSTTETDLWGDRYQRHRDNVGNPKRGGIAQNLRSAKAETIHSSRSSASRIRSLKGVDFDGAFAFASIGTGILAIITWLAIVYAAYQVSIFEAILAALMSPIAVAIFAIPEFLVLLILGSIYSIFSK